MIDYVPHVDLLLRALRINRERLNSKSKIAIDAKLLRTLLQTLLSHMEFSEQFYLDTYPDIAEAHAAGDIPDLHRHFIDLGYFEGRLGYPPSVDEDYYAALYKDVGAAVQRGEIVSGNEHYMRAGAAEGRIPNAQLKPVIESWSMLLREEVPRP